MKIGDIIVPKRIYARHNLPPVAIIVDGDITPGTDLQRYRVLVKERIESWGIKYCRKYFKALK